MRLDKLHLLACLTGTMLVLCSCGGGGGVESASKTPSPTPAPPPPGPTPAPAPAPQGAWYDTSRSAQFASLASYSEHVGHGTGPASSTIAADGADRVQIEYSVAQNSYLVTLPGLPQGRLVGSNLVDTNGNRLASVDLQSRDLGFTYANIGQWTIGAGTNDLKIGAFAFGTPTAAGDVPLTGSATYSGKISAQTDEAYVRSSEGYVSPSFVDGSVTMNFDFAGGKLSGSIAPMLNCWGCLWEDPVGDLKFAQTVYSPGSTSYSGKFDTALSGPNWFRGMFAGPNAVETLAKFQAPYLDPYTHALHVMSGVWVAKNH